MLGIPTRSDVQNSEYQSTVEVEGLRRELEISRWPTSSHFLHNHVVGAKRKKEQEGGNPLNYLNPRLVLDHYKDRIRGYRDALDVAEQNEYTRPYGKLSTNTDINFDQFSDSKAIRRRPFEESLVTLDTPFNSMQNDSSESTNAETKYHFNYSWIPLQLARFELDEYEGQLIDAYTSSSKPNIQIKNIWEVNQIFDGSANKNLIGDSVLADFMRPDSIEITKETEAYELREQNKKIAEASDIYLRFDEFYIVVNGNGRQHLIPSSVLLDEDVILTSGNLYHRQSLRREISNLVDHMDEFIFNGTTYSLDRSKQIFHSVGEVIKPLVNILGIPVSDRNGFIEHPDAWAIRELELIKQYRTEKEEIVAIIMQEYEGFENRGGISTQQEKLFNLEHAING